MLGTPRQGQLGCGDGAAQIGRHTAGLRVEPNRQHGLFLGGEIFQRSALQDRVYGLGLLNAFLGKGTVKQPRLVGLSSEKEIVFRHQSVNEIGNEIQDEGKGRSIVSFIEGVIPSGFAVTEKENGAFGEGGVTAIVGRDIGKILHRIFFGQRKLLVATKEEILNGGQK